MSTRTRSPTASPRVSCSPRSTTSSRSVASNHPVNDEQHGTRLQPRWLGFRGSVDDPDLRTLEQVERAEVVVDAVPGLGRPGGVPALHPAPGGDEARRGLAAFGDLVNVAHAA